MASLAHVVVGAAGGRILQPDSRLPWRSMVALAALSLMADLDVLAFRFGIAYSAPFGHRGATHSIAFALAAGCAGALLSRRGVRMLSRCGLQVIAFEAVWFAPLLVWAGWPRHGGRR